MPEPSREAHKTMIKGPAAGEDLTRSWYKNLPRASHEISDKHLQGPSLCAHGRLTRAVLCENLQGKCHAPGPGQPSDEMHMDISQEQNWQEKCRGLDGAPSYRQNPSVWTHYLRENTTTMEERFQDCIDDITAYYPYIAAFQLYLRLEVAKDL